MDGRDEENMSAGAAFNASGVFQKIDWGDCQCVSLCEYCMTKICCR